MRAKAIERGRAKVPKIVNTCLCNDFKKLSYDPYDMKPVMNPVDFVVFHGLNEGKSVRDITFLTRTPCAAIRPMIESLKATVDNGHYDWKVARITTAGKVNYE